MLRPGLLLLSLVLLASPSCKAKAQATDRARLHSHPGPIADSAPVGLSELSIPGGRSAFLYLPRTYQRDQPAPLLVLFHGATQNSDLWTQNPHLFQLADSVGVVLLMPNSIGNSWDLMRGGFGPDVVRLDSALAMVYRRVNIAPDKVGLGGFSDGATYALSLGISNGDIIAAILAFSPGYLAPEAERGKPPVFISHGTNDRILPIEHTSHQIRPLLEQKGITVSYHEFPDGHTMIPELVRLAFRWFVKEKRP